MRLGLRRPRFIDGFKLGEPIDKSGSTKSPKSLLKLHNHVTTCSICFYDTTYPFTAEPTAPSMK